MAKKKVKEPELIDTLTPEQQAKIPSYLEKYRNIGLSTRPTDKVRAEKALRASYKYLKMQDPEIRWVESPIKGAIMAAQEAKGSMDVTVEEVRDQASKASYGQFEAYWVSTPSFIAYELPVKRDELIDIVNEIVEEVNVYWTFEDLIIACEKPKSIHMQNEKLHNPDGLAIEYNDGWGVFAIEGERYPSMMAMLLAKHEQKEVTNE